MNSETANAQDAFFDDLAAEFTNAAYAVVLRHGVGREWLGLELDLWEAMSETVKRLEQTQVDCGTRGCIAAKISDFFG